MSLILDALRKSEAERQRGQSPSLYSAMPVPSIRRAPAWLRLLPVLLGAMLLLAAGWFALRNAGEPAMKAQPQAGDADASASEIPGDEWAPAPAGAGLSVAPAGPLAPDLAPTVLPTTAPAPAAATSAPVPVPVPVPPAVDTAPTSAPAVSAATAPAPLPLEPAATSAAPADALPPVAVLDAGTRSALPPMKLSMHVYNADPARRFAIIDGQRVIEGAQLGAASVVEIRRDGVVLDVGGRRVLLPRP